VVLTWKRIVFVIIFAALFYGGCNTQSMLATEEFFRDENPNLALTPTVCYWLADAAYLTFRYDLAIDIINRNLKDFPYEDGADDQEYKRAVCYEKIGDYQRAIGLFETFLTQHPRDGRYTLIEDKIGKLRSYGKASE
jgi:tetratricopeptide (TPR) repeat protein